MKRARSASSSLDDKEDDDATAKRRRNNEASGTHSRFQPTKNDTDTDSTSSISLEEEGARKGVERGGRAVARGRPRHGTRGCGGELLIRRNCFIAEFSPRQLQEEQKWLKDLLREKVTR